MALTNWSIWDRIREFTRSNRIYQQERIFQDQASLDRVVTGRDFLDWNSQSAILQQTNLQINRFERYRDFERMDQNGSVISQALDLYADEISLCLDGETRIPLLDGTLPTIRELASRGPEAKFWVYAVDRATGRYVPAEAYNARVTRRNATMVSVKLDDGTIIRTTPDHKFMLRNGTFRRADRLLPGDSLKPLYRRVRYRAKGKTTWFDKQPYPTASGYEFLFTGAHFESTHRWVHNALFDNNPQVIHHNDFNSRNNTPDNLIGMSCRDHNITHCRVGNKNPSFKNVDLADIIAWLNTRRGNITRDDIYKQFGIGFRVLDRILSDAGMVWSQLKANYHRCNCGEPVSGTKRVCRKCTRSLAAQAHQRMKNDKNYCERRKLAKRRSYQHISERICRACNNSLPISDFDRLDYTRGCVISPYCKACRPSSVQKRYLKKSFDNHKVVEVVAAGVVEEAFDITVPGYECFAAGGEFGWVIVHNCDPEVKHNIIIKAKNKRIKRELEELYYGTLLIDRLIRPGSRYLCKMGDCPYEIVLDRHRSGVAGLRFMNVYNFTRIETRLGDLVGFFFQDEFMQEPVFLHPWAVCHLRLTSLENIYAPYGISILAGSRKAFKQLELMQDGALIRRVTRANIKRKFKIPVGMIPAKEIPGYMQDIARLFKRQRFYNPSTGTFDERYSPIIDEDDFFLPLRPDGSGPDVENLEGDVGLDQIADIEYFKKNMVAPLKIPYARVGIGEGAGEPNEKSLSQSDAEFAKAVRWPQSEIAFGLQKIGIIHLALRGYSAADVGGFELSLASTSALEDLYRMETWQSRVNVMSDLKDIGWFPKEWIVTHFTDMSPDELEELKDLEDEETGEGGGGGGGGLGGGGMGDMDMGPAGPEPGADEEDLEDIESEDEEQPLEGWDADRERKLIMEVRKDESRRKKKQVLNRINKRRSVKLNSGFKYMLESKEFDGLSADRVNSYGDEANYLVGPSVTLTEAQDAILQTKSLLTEEVERQIILPEDVTPADLPA